MTCVICEYPERRRLLLENLAKEGKDVEELGQQFRVPYEDVKTHLTEHLKPSDVSYVSKVETMLEELADMVEVARIMAESEESDAVNFTAYGGLVKNYHAMAMDLHDRKEKERQEAIKTDALTDAIQTKVLAPILTDLTKIVLGELARLKAELRKHSRNPEMDTQFEDTTRRIGSQLQQCVDPYIDTLRICAEGTKDKKRK